MAQEPKTPPADKGGSAKKPRVKSTPAEHFKRIGERLSSHQEVAPAEIKVSLVLKGEKAKNFLRGYGVFVKSCQEAGIPHSLELYQEACQDFAQESLFKPSLMPLAEAVAIFNATPHGRSAGRPAGAPAATPRTPAAPASAGTKVEV